MVSPLWQDMQKAMNKEIHQSFVPALGVPSFRRAYSLFGVLMTIFIQGEL